MRPAEVEQRVPEAKEPSNVAQIDDARGLPASSASAPGVRSERGNAVTEVHARVDRVHRATDSRGA
jgi:hypothetical protein